MNNHCQSIQTFPYSSLAHQNKPITSIHTEVILSSRINFDVGLSVIGSKEVMWILRFECWKFVPSPIHIHKTLSTLPYLWFSLMTSNTKSIRGVCEWTNDSWFSWTFIYSYPDTERGAFWSTCWGIRQTRVSGQITKRYPLLECAVGFHCIGNLKT